MLIKEEILRAVAQLEIRARKNITSLLSGSYRSAFRGSGMQFKEFRHYEPGDDIRHMSWPVTARTGRATVKVYEEERELDIILMVDVSGSTLFGIGEKKKLDVYGELMALVGLAAVKSSDNVGLLLFDDKPRAYIPARRTRHHVHALLTRLLEQPFSGQKSDLREALTYANRILSHRSLIMVISDFIMPGFETELATVSHKHEVILLHCADDAERGLRLMASMRFAIRKPANFIYWMENPKRPNSSWPWNKQN